MAAATTSVVCQSTTIPSCASTAAGATRSRHGFLPKRLCAAASPAGCVGAAPAPGRLGVWGGGGAAGGGGGGFGHGRAPRRMGGRGGEGWGPGRRLSACRGPRQDNVRGCTCDRANLGG